MKLSWIRDLTERGCHGEALVAISVLELVLAHSREVLYLTAVNQRCLGQCGAALATLERLQQQAPRFSRLYEERGYCFAAMNDISRAIDAFECGVNINAALSSSWSMLERLYSASGDLKKAATAAGHLDMLRRLPAPIIQAGSLFCDGELIPAENIVRSYLRTSGEHPEALRLLGRIVHQRRVLDDAEELLARVLQLAPAYRAARADYARVLIDSQKYLQAREEIGRLLQLEPDNKDYLSLNATVWAGLGDHPRAIALYRELLSVVPDWHHLYLLLGNSLRAIGRQNEAIESYRAAANDQSLRAAAYWSLANLKTYRFTADEIERMRLAEASSATQPDDRCHLCFSLGKAFEDRAEYAQSWSYYKRGNALKGAQDRYHPQVTETATGNQIEVCTAEFFSSRATCGVPDPAPIFIVGLPRAGSTLVEQILASHSQVEGTQELSDIERMVHRLQGRLRRTGNSAGMGALASPIVEDTGYPGYPAVLARLGTADFRRLGEEYLSDTRPYREGKPHFIDKMPNNFRHVGLIHLMLPQATIIDVRREPMACCFSNLKQLFASGQPFTYSMENLARYYRSYLELMRHWDEMLPGRVLRVWYEDMVEDLETGVRRLLQCCRLEFEPACIDFYKTARPVNSASSEQVRRPLFRSGLSQWRHYEPWLDPLKEALGDALIRYRE